MYIECSSSIINHHVLRKKATIKENLWEYWKICTYYKPNINVYA